MNEQQVRTVGPRTIFWRKSNVARALGILGVVAGVATGTWAVEESAKVDSAGLRDLISSEVPADLTAEEFAKLDGNWAEWSKGAAAAVADFYGKLQTADSAGQRSALKVLKSKLDVMQRAIDDPRYVSLMQPLVVLQGRLSERVAIAEAVLDALEPDKDKMRADRLAGSAREVVESVAALRAYLNKVPGGTAWLPYVRADVVERQLSTSPNSPAAADAVRNGKGRIAGRADLKDDKQKEFLSRPPFLAYEGALDNYLAATTWEPPVVNQADVRTQLKDLLDAVDSYSNTRSSESAAKIRAGLVGISKVTADGGDRISSTLDKYVLNYNVRLLASEEFLNRVMSESRTEQGPVVDNVLGAAVSGSQTTNTKVTFDLLPSPRTARFNLTLNGNIQSNTVGVTNEASVYTYGNHQFTAWKEVNFDGTRFTTGPADITVSPHNTTTGVATNMGGFLFGGIARNIASQEVEKRRPQAEAIAASRVRERVLPPFNSEVDKNFAEASGKLERDLFSGLKATGLYPDVYTYQTTNTVLKLNSRLLGPGEAGGNLPRAVVYPNRGATLLLHETAINNAVNRIGLAGQTLTEPQLRAKLEEFFSKALSREVKIPAPHEQTPKTTPEPKEEPDDDKGPSAIIFAQEDPIRVAFENGELILTLRAGFKQEGKDDIPTREITVPLTYEIKGRKIFMTSGTISVVAADGSGGGFAINGVVRKKIQSALPDREIDSKVEMKGAKKTAVAYINGIRFIDNWAAISVE